MKVRITGALLAISGVLLAATFVGSGVFAQTAEDPEREPLPSDGTLVEVSDTEGDRLICPDGEPLLVQVGTDAPEGIGAAHPISTSEAAQYGFDTGPGGADEGIAIVEETDPAVPRCGPSGGGTDSEPIWVPESVGEDRVTAPERYVKEQTGD